MKDAKANNPPDIIGVFPPSTGLRKMQTLQSKLLRAARLVILQKRTQIPIDDEIHLIFKSCETLKHLGNVVVGEQQITGISKGIMGMNNQIYPIHEDEPEHAEVKEIFKEEDQNISKARRNSAASNYADSKRGSTRRKSLTTQTEMLAVNAERYAMYVNAPGDPLQIAKRLTWYDNDQSHQMMKQTIKIARNESSKIQSHMETFRTDDEKGVFLIQQFLVHCVAGNT